MFCLQYKQYIIIYYKCSIGKGGGRVFMEKVYRSSKWWEVKDWGESVSELMIGGKKTTNCTQYCLDWVFLPFVHVKFWFVSCVLLLVLSCLVCSYCWFGRVYCCSCLVCIVVVVLCVVIVGLAVCIVVVILCGCYLMCICCTMCVLLFLL